MIFKKLINYNYSSRNKESIKYIVIHDTGNLSKGADANAHYNYFNTKDRQASAHYFVDDSKVLQVVEDFNASWHCGDGNGKFGITNSNSIGVEICINSDGDYNKALDHTVELVKDLMSNYSIPIERVVRHFDASKKICPKTMSENNWDKWDKFRDSLDLSRALDILVKKDIINSPSYWKENAREGKMVRGEFSASLIKRVAAKI
ncbi:N-acetylmuramoyl-L-alanine amidase family protein [Natranaerobius trueperi]|uniref:N-acetylmuramoyl-L-alanine amidase n=1 Tax=Natranaerobius trueperi TaxID=759412 RepID=A0A226BW73_9FIRM|nr:peptidoglycan recognition family protein [Natranaerobius trueperi]OWZ83243.1 N-acetylmuramoyl-L-alanine amidase [Natranaerobius trueperi]